MAKIDLGSVVGEVDQETIMEFTPPDTYTPPATGDKINIIFGKITKGLADLFLNKFDKGNIVNNLATTLAGYALDARQGKALDDKINVINNTLTSTNSKLTLNNTVGDAPTNLLLVGGDLNQRTILSNTTINYINSPVAGAFMGVRDVYQLSPSHFLIEIRECYPVAGRVWNNFYNVSAWTGWKSKTPV